VKRRQRLLLDEPPAVATAALVLGRHGRRDPRVVVAPPVNGSRGLIALLIEVKLIDVMSDHRLRS